MENKFDKIHTWVMQEIEGDLSEPDRVHLLQLAAEDPEVAEVRDHLWKTVGSGEIAEYLLQHPAAEQAAKLLERIDAPKRRSGAIIYIGSAAAAAAVILFISIRLGVFTNGVVDKPVAANAGNQVGKNTVQLALSGGTVYDIKGDTSLRTATAGTWNVAGKTLTYKAVPAETQQYATLLVPAGKDYSLVLPDGSRIQVNAASSVKFPLAFKGNTRDIHITGEAYIKAASDPLRPLRVHLPGSVVEVLGTEFNVNAYDSLAKIALVSGKIRVQSGKESTLLSPGSMGVVSPGGISVESFDEYETLSWRTGQFVFRNAKFEDICKVIPRWFGVHVVFDNKQASDKRFSGLIDRYQPLELQLKGLKATGAIDYNIAGDGTIHIKFM